MVYARAVLIFIVGLGLSVAPVTARAGEHDATSEPTEGKPASNYQPGRFLVDGGFGIVNPSSFLLPFPFLRARYQVNRYFAVEQVNRVLIPFAFSHLIGVRGQVPLTKSWSFFTAGRLGIGVGSLQTAGIAGGASVVGVGIERLLSTGLLYGLEFGAGRSYSQQWDPGRVYLYYQLNLGYAF